MEAAQGLVRFLKETFRVGQQVHISKEKMRFAKAAEQNFSTEIFRFANVIDRRPPAVYELEDLNRTPIDGQLHREEMIPVRITYRTPYKIDKILDKRVDLAFVIISSAGKVTVRTLTLGCLQLA